MKDCFTQRLKGLFRRKCRPAPRPAHEPTRRTIRMMDELEKDHEFLTAGNVFPEELITNWIRTLRKDAASVNNIPHPAEFDLYYDL